MDFVTGEELGKDLCKVLNLDPNKVKDITITGSAGGEAVVDVRMYISEEEGSLLKEVLKHYRLERGVKWTT